MKKDTVKKRPKQKEWTIVNDHDGNDTFTVKATTFDEAQRIALQELG